MAEKGSVNVFIKVETLGGHSSVPPSHTGSKYGPSPSAKGHLVGIISLLLAELEANPFLPEFNPDGPYIKYLTCLAEYAPEMPKKLKARIQDPRAWDELAIEMARGDRKTNSLLATSQAIDLIKGGVKINALPEVVDGKYSDIV
jgi:Gly-Xaa carboxypeptidase